MHQPCISPCISHASAMHQFCISRDAGNARRRRRCQTLHTLEECSQLGGAEMYEMQGFILW